MTDPFDADAAAAQAAQAAGHQLEQQHTADQQALAAETAKEQADQATIAAQAAQITELENELHPQPTPTPAPTPQPAPQPTLAWGANIGTNTGQLAKVDQALGGIGAARFYFNPGKGIHYPTSADLGGDLGNRILILSAKLLPQDVVAGKYDQQITATAKACPTPNPTLLCLWHEPENDSAFTAQQFRDAQAHFAQLVHAAGNPQVKVALILMGETWNGHAGRNWRDWYAGPQSADVFCTDEYVWGPGVSLDGIFAGCRAAADAEGKPCSVTETGVDPSTYPAPAAYGALTKLAQRVKAVSNGPVAMYFGAMPGSRWDLCTDPKRLAAWKAGQAA